MAVEVRVAVLDVQHLPAVGLVARADVLGERPGGRPVERDVVVVVEVEQLAELQVAGEGRRLGGDPFHQVAVGDEREGAVVDDLVPGPVEARGERALGHRHADGVGGALPERTGRGLDARRQQRLGMARRAAAPLPERLQVVERQVVAGQVQQRVEQHAAVARPRARSGRGRPSAGRADCACRCRCQRTYAIGAAPSGRPGCPEFAFWTASIASVRIVLTQSSSRPSWSVLKTRPLLLGPRS